MNARQKEARNFHKLDALLADYGFDCMRLSSDREGADFVACSERETLRVQLKSRLTIAKKFLDKGLWIAFPHRGSWYLVDHDRLVTLRKPDGLFRPRALGRAAGSSPRWIRAA